MSCKGAITEFFFFQSSTLYKIGSRKDDFNFGLSFLERVTFHMKKTVLVSFREKVSHGVAAQATPDSCPPQTVHDSSNNCTVKLNLWVVIFSLYRFQGEYKDWIDMVCWRKWFKLGLGGNCCSFGAMGLMMDWTCDRQRSLIFGGQQAVIVEGLLILLLIDEGSSFNEMGSNRGTV